MLDMFTPVNKTNQQKPVINRHTKTYDEKLAEELYDQFTSKDVVEHFERYYKKANGKDKEYSKDKALSIVEELFRDGFSAGDLTLYIEFVFESDQTVIDKEKCGMGTFKIQKWVDYIEANLDAFEAGQSVQKVEEKQKFESNIDTHKEWNRKKKGRVVFELPRYY